MKYRQAVYKREVPGLPTTGSTEGRDYGAATPCRPGLTATEAEYVKQLGPSTHPPVGCGRPLTCIVNAVSV